jgi:hypothetical protein
MFDPAMFDPTTRLHSVKAQHHSAHQSAHARRHAASLRPRRRALSLRGVFRQARRIVPAVRSPLPAPCPTPLAQVTGPFTRQST